MPTWNINLIEIPTHYGTPAEIAPPEGHEAALTRAHHSNRSAIRMCPVASNYIIGKDLVPLDQPQQIVIRRRISMTASPTPGLPELTDTLAGWYIHQLGNI
jgi:hypothetical protein